MTVKRTLTILFCCWAVALMQGLPGSGRLQLQLVPGQVLKLELSSGDYRIEPGASDKLVVISKMSEATARFGVDANSKQASVKVDGPPNYVAVIQIPRNSDLHVRLNGGRLQVAGIEGDKDIESHAGTVSIQVGAPESYAKVDASVGVGHVDARVFQSDQEGFGKSFHRQGPGRYHLHAHVGEGEITFFSDMI
jgi:hypothetical protein